MQRIGCDSLQFVMLLVPLNESKYFEKIIYVHQRNNNNCVDATVVITAGTEFRLVLTAFWIPEKRLFKSRNLVCLTGKVDIIISFTQLIQLRAVQLTNGVFY